ncbi:MAG TPA: class I SAM-dependent methyltransferase [Jiangellaceae bacterium]
MTRKVPVITGLSAAEVVAAGYDRIAPRYAEWQTRIIGDPRARYVERMLSFLPPDPDILEIGCGAGVEPTPTFAELGNLTGVDISGEQIDRARAAVPAGEFVHADILDLQFADQSFDAIVALFVLTHVPTDLLPDLLNRVSSWLRPGGAFLATFSSAGEHHELVEDWLGVAMFFSGLDVAGNEALVKTAGLRVLESRVEPMQAPDGEDSFHWVVASATTVSRDHVQSTSKFRGRLNMIMGWGG